MTWIQVKGWVARLIEDPDGSPSSTRVAALLTTITGCGIAVYGMVIGREQAATVVALLGGSSATFFARKKSVDPQPTIAP